MITVLTALYLFGLFLIILEPDTNSRLGVLKPREGKNIYWNGYLPIISCAALCNDYLCGKESDRSQKIWLLICILLYPISFIAGSIFLRKKVNEGKAAANKNTDS